MESREEAGTLSSFAAVGGAARLQDENGQESRDTGILPLPSPSRPEGGILGVRLHKAGQVFYLSFAGLAVRPGMKVMARLDKDQVLCEVVSLVDRETAELLNKDKLHGEVLGPASAQEIAEGEKIQALAVEAAVFCKNCIRQRGLDMKLVDVSVLHDRSKITFFFTAPARIDFRELVKDLVRAYRMRIELRQIGVRHETQMVGGIGNCGAVCCCHSFLRKFAPVTIKMAKEQNLFLNPAKLSGMCGRLLCCLSFEQSNYDEFHRQCPRLGKKYSTSQGVIKPLRTNLFNGRIACLTAANEEVEFSLEEWEKLQPRRLEAGNQDPAPREEDFGREESWEEEGELPL
ncbi:MAG: hypothetical protein LBO77_05420 [Desulfovibrio sp.]|jgi:cell fate regulator YaaT (PSP1 superfamily)|nr:hypothetical protein [Desulfovibrio sp.]